MKSQTKRQVLVYLPVEQHQRLKKMAAETSTSMSELVSRALARWTYRRTAR
jgi:hypothetical protein